MKHSSGFTLIEVLVAVFLLGVSTVAITGLVVLSTRLSLESERQSVALAIASKHIEYIRSLPYEDVGMINDDPVGVLSAEQSSQANGQTYTLLTDVELAKHNNASFSQTDTLNADYKNVTVTVRWNAASGTEREVVSTTVITPAGSILTCTPGETSCPNGAMCPSSGRCDGPIACIAGTRTCGGGQLVCPASGYCPDAYPNYPASCPAEAIFCGSFGSTVDVKVNGYDGPVYLEPGSGYTLSWSAGNSGSCTASGAWSGSKATPSGNESGSVGSSASYTYTLTCTQPGCEGILCTESSDSVTVITEDKQIAVSVAGPQSGELVHSGSGMVASFVSRIKNIGSDTLQSVSLYGVINGSRQFNASGSSAECSDQGAYVECAYSSITPGATEESTTSLTIPGTDAECTSGSITGGANCCGFNIEDHQVAVLDSDTVYRTARVSGGTFMSCQAMFMKDTGSGIQVLETLDSAPHSFSYAEFNNYIRTVDGYTADYSAGAWTVDTCGTGCNDTFSADSMCQFHSVADARQQCAFRSQGAVEYQPMIIFTFPSDYAVQGLRNTQIYLKEIVSNES